jgi:hypothetical protein
MKCLKIKHLLLFTKIFEEKMRNHNDLMQNLKLIFKLIGSVKEGKRVGDGNELDFTIVFEELVELIEPPFQVKEGIFHLTITEHAPAWMDGNFDVNGRFMRHFLEAAKSCIESSFRERAIPSNVKKHTSEEEFFVDEHICGTCQKQHDQAEKKVTPFKQFKHAAVTVSQTKMGACLQLFWYPNAKNSEKFYTCRFSSYVSNETS